MIVKFGKIFWPKDLTGFKNLSGLIALIFQNRANTQVCPYINVKIGQTHRFAPT